MDWIQIIYNFEILCFSPIVIYVSSGNIVKTLFLFPTMDFMFWILLFLKSVIYLFTWCIPNNKIFMFSLQSPISTRRWERHRLVMYDFYWSTGRIHKMRTAHFSFVAEICPYIMFLLQIMMTSSNGYIFRVTCPLCGEFTGDRWIPSTKASDAELWCFLWSLSE